MSYSASLPGWTYMEGDAIPLDYLQVSPPLDALHDEPRGQLASALDAVNELLQAGVLGDEGTKVNIVISGHANPEYDNTGRDGSPNHVNINLSSVRQDVEQPPVRVNNEDTDGDGA